MCWTMVLDEAYHIHTRSPLLKPRLEWEHGGDNLGGSMKRILTIAAIPVLCAPLAAGTLAGKVMSKAGGPVANAKITIRRMDINWSKETLANPRGSYLQSGLESKDYEVTYSAEGYVPVKFMVKVTITDTVTQDATLMTVQEAQAEAAKKDPNAQSRLAETSGAEAFNSGISLYNTQSFAEALPLFEKAYASYQESMEKTKDEKEKANLTNSINVVERVLGISLFEVGKTDETKKADNWAKAEPMLTGVLSRIEAKEETKGQRLQVMKALRDIAQEKKATATVDKLQTEIDKIEPPNAANDYNKAVDAFNAGNNAEAKSCLERAIRKDPKFADSYYLMGMVEFGNNDLKATKQNLMKYLEVAPTGKKASEVKAMLDDPSLKKIKL